jgi:hypothetical protein
VLDGNFALGCGPETDYPKIHTYISMYARTNKCYNEQSFEPITFVLAYPTAHGVGSGGIPPSILNLGARAGVWSAPNPGRVKPAKKRRYLLERRLAGPQSQTGRFGEKKNLLSLKCSQPNYRLWLLRQILFRGFG